MPYPIDPITGRQIRGFAAMSKAVRTEFARKGGAGVPDHKRSFTKDRDLAAEAGRKGGEAHRRRA